MHVITKTILQMNDNFRILISETRKLFALNALHASLLNLKITYWTKQERATVYIYTHL